LLPGLEIRHQDPLYVISKRSTDAQHCLKVAAPWTGHKLALVGGMGDLVQVAIFTRSNKRWKNDPLHALHFWILVPHFPL
jgi:hypothetical protein